jgi:hypothetical protein
MRILRSKKSVDEMVELARVYCTMLMTYRLAKEQGTLSSHQDIVAQSDLAEMDGVLTRLKITPSKTTQAKVHALIIVAPRLHSQRQNHDRQQHSA